MSIIADCKPVLFFGTNNKINVYPFLSNFFKAPIVDPATPHVTYTCVEQYFQHKKALFALDEETAAKILQTNNPVAQKRLGRKARFDPKNVGHTIHDWDRSESVRVMQEAVTLKFTQNPELGLKLAGTGSRPIGECNPRDKLWGIGLGRDVPAAQDPTMWVGKNRLGKILMDVRTQLQRSKE
jgi:ribA/ribD-fused uncharacterized protein